jgi:hypothetical protein
LEFIQDVLVRMELLGLTMVVALEALVLIQQLITAEVTVQMLDQ